MLDMQEAISEMSQKFNEHLEELIVQRFGSVEEFKKVAHLYILEENSSPFEIAPSAYALNVSYVMSVTYRLRLKTFAELELG